MKNRIVIVAAVAVFGVALGYIGGFIQFTNESSHGAEQSSWHHEWIMLPALPGILISSSTSPVDYQLTEHWVQDKHSMAFWNGLVFAVLAMPPVLLIRRKRRTSNNELESIVA